jgi:hypothetical protein
MATTRTHFTFRVDTWTPDGESVVEHVAGIEDYQLALATYHAACQRWPGIPITLRQGARREGIGAAEATLPGGNTPGSPVFRVEYRPDEGVKCSIRVVQSYRVR